MSMGCEAVDIKCDATNVGYMMSMVDQRLLVPLWECLQERCWPEFLIPGNPHRNIGHPQRKYRDGLKDYSINRVAPRLPYLSSVSSPDHASTWMSRLVGISAVTAAMGMVVATATALRCRIPSASHEPML